MTEKHLSTSTDLPIYFLHGWGMSARIWQVYFDWQQQALEGFASCIALDLPGYGQAHEHAQHAVNLAQMTRYIDEKINTKCILVAWSLGGLVATQLCLQNPEKYKALVTVASSPKFVQADDWPGMKMSVLALFGQQLASDYHALLKRFVAIQSLGTDNAKLQSKTILTHLNQSPAPQAKVLASGLDILKTTDLRKQMTALKSPHLAVFGKLDSLVPKQAIPAINSLLPRSQIVTLEKASHAPFLSHPQVFTDTLKTFIAKQC